MDWSALLPLGGVVLGGVLATSGGVISERLKWKRAQAARWDTTRQIAYAEFATAVKVETRIYLKMATSMGLAWDGDDLDPVHGLQLLADAEDTRSAKFETVLLVGDPDTVAAGRLWQDCVWQMRVILRQDYSDGSGEFKELFHRAGQARNEFHNCARGDLGVDGSLAEPGLYDPVARP